VHLTVEIVPLSVLFLSVCLAHQSPLAAIPVDQVVTECFRVHERALVACAYYPEFYERAANLQLDVDVARQQVG